MSGIAHSLYAGVQYVLGFGATVMLPIILFIMSLCFRVKIGKAIRSALTVGIGFVGIYAIYDIMTNNIGPAAKAMVQNTGINLPVVDLGWPPLSAITWGIPIAPFVILLTIVINVILIALKKIRTVDVDLWNYWHFALAGTLIYYNTHNFILAMLGSAVVIIVVFLIADWSAPMVQNTFGLPGISLPTTSSAIFFPVGLLGNWIIDKIPVIRDININPKTIQKRFGVLGEPMMIGLILGILLGIVAGYDVKGIFNIGINIAAVMFILPRMVRILMEGLMPLSEAIKEFLHKRYPDRDDLYIGLDIAVAVGDPAIISTALLLTPVAVLIALVLPGNAVLPLGDLVGFPVLCSMVVLATRGNIFRTFIISLPIIVADLYISSSIAPIVTNMAKSVNYNIGSASSVSSFLDGGNPLRYWVMKIFEGNFIAIGLIPVIIALVYFTYKATFKQTHLLEDIAEK